MHGEVVFPCSSIDNFLSVRTARLRPYSVHATSQYQLGQELDYMHAYIVLLECITELQNYFDIDKWQINQPILISEVKNLIGGVEGVQTVEKTVFETSLQW